MNLSRRYTEITAPAVEPVTLELLKSHCRVDITEDDDDITRLGKVARRHVEEICGRKLISQTWDVYYDSFGSEMILPFSPLKEIGSVQYYDTSGTLATVAVTVFEAGAALSVPKIRLQYNQSWPSAQGREDGIICRCVFGYGAAATSVPDEYLHAIKCLVEFWYDNRGEEGKIPDFVYNILVPYRIHYPIC